jgi:uncharacterized protein GlcG (DUF336 family)
LRNADSKADTRNLNTIPELLLLSGGTPVYFEGEIIGSVGIAGGGSPENDDPRSGNYNRQSTYQIIQI